MYFDLFDIILSVLYIYGGTFGGTLLKIINLAHYVFNLILLKRATLSEYTYITAVFALKIWYKIRYNDHFLNNKNNIS